ncbi:MAG TPA: LacI family DNA-binding transcriptional regulator [Kofleriaceae bacterium]|nr:LacI family DNA-binding transcriptional regulator [Kofleriaceae bacterium]
MREAGPPDPPGRAGLAGPPRPPAAGPRRPPTLEAVASLAGVSRATVSRVVNGSPKVSPAAQEAVTEAIGALGYVPNRAARSLVTRRTDTLVLIVHERPDTVFEDPFFARVLRGVNAALDATELQLVLLQARGDRQRERALRYVGNGHVDGVLLISLHGDDPMPAAITAAGIPLVVMGRPLSGERGDYVDADNAAGGHEAVRHLVAAGRRCLATVTGSLDMSVGRDRLSGYVEAVRAAAMPAAAGRVAHGDFTEASGHRAMKLLVEATTDIDGVFVASDLMALGALRALRELGRRVPDDVAVVGFDDAPLAAYADPPLTTVRQPVERLGQEMVRLLLDRLSEPAGEPKAIILPTELVVRSSA